MGENKWLYVINCSLYVLQGVEIQAVAKIKVPNIQDEPLK